MNKTIKVLLIEDERKIANFIKRGLNETGFIVDESLTGMEGLEKIQNKEYSLIILDLMLPDLDGFDVCSKIRELDIRYPVLILTARNSTEDKVKGLDMGADDYLTKPFAINELVARVKALLRRGPSVIDNVLKVGDLVLNIKTHEVYRNGKYIELSQKEFVILEYLMLNTGVVLTRSMIEEHAWDYEFDGFSNVVDVYIRLLRKKIDDEYKNKIIKTVRGFGYKIQA
ncbi:response regulator transcription factor [Patescibacteria group bacterium]|nr:response regulator transcription factor [Patescibacteria group bacterium]